MAEYFIDSATKYEGKSTRKTSTILNELIIDKLKQSEIKDGIKETNNYIRIHKKEDDGCNEYIIVYPSPVSGNYFTLHQYRVFISDDHQDYNEINVYNICLDTLFLSANYVMDKFNSIGHYNSFKLDIYNLPVNLREYDNIITFYKICASIKSCEELMTFHLCLYKKITDKNIRLHILSFIYG